VVRVRRDDGSDLWLDPACAVCAPGELRPVLWAADALSEGVERLPEPPEGRLVETVEVQPDGNQHFVVEYMGTAALALRLDLLDEPANARIAFLEERHGGTVTSHQGLGERGGSIRLEGVRPGVLDPPPPHERLDVPQSEYILVPWRGERIREVRVPQGVSDVLLAPALDAEVGGMELRWTRTLGVDGSGTRIAHDVWTIDEAVLSRDSLVALRDRMVTTVPVLLSVPGDAPPAATEPPAAESD
jgi:hypothetical protein